MSSKTSPSADSGYAALESPVVAPHILIKRLEDENSEPLRLGVRLENLVGEVKSLIEEQLGVPQSNQTLIFQKTPLDDGKTLEESAIVDGSMLILLMKVETKRGVRSEAQVASVDTGVLGAGAAAMDGGYPDDGVLYLAGSKGLAVMDVSDLPNTTTKRIIDTEALSHDGGAVVIMHSVLPAFDLLYVASGKGLAVMDLEVNKWNPPRIGSVIDTGALAHNGGVAAHRSGYCRHVYIAGGNGLAVMDVTYEHSREPSVIGDVIDIGALALAGGVAMIALEREDVEPVGILGVAGVLYVAGGKGLGVFDLTEWGKKPLRIDDVIDTGALTWDGGAAMAVRENFLYVAGGHGLAVFDIADKRKPSRIGDVLDTGCLSHDGPAAMEIDGLSLIIAGGKGLGLFSIADPAKPSPQGDIIDTGCLSNDGGCGLLITDDAVFVAGGEGLAVFDKKLMGLLEVPKIECPSDNEYGPEF